MKFEEFTEKMLLAFEDTVEAYEILIEVLETGDDEAKQKILSKWWGRTARCRLCMVDGEQGIGNCNTCILSKEKTRQIPCTAGDAWASRHLIYEAINRAHDDYNQILEAARARLAWLLKRAAENDVVMK